MPVQRSFQAKYATAEATEDIIVEKTALLEQEAQKPMTAASSDMDVSRSRPATTGI